MYFRTSDSSDHPSLLFRRSYLQHNFQSSALHSLIDGMFDVILCFGICSEKPGLLLFSKVVEFHVLPKYIYRLALPTAPVKMERVHCKRGHIERLKVVSM